jgi:hypothetical protein
VESAQGPRLLASGPSAHNIPHVPDAACPWITPCAEFPNDNELLHRGAIWRCVGATGPATACSLAPDSLLDDVDGSEESVELGVDAAIEVVEDLVFDALDEAPFVAEPPDPACTEGRPEGAGMDDGFALLLGILRDVAAASGADPSAIEFVGALLGGARTEGRSPGPRGEDALLEAGLVTRGPRGLTRTPEFAGRVLAWQAVLRNETEDFAACGTLMLDEWCADVVARTLGETGRIPSIRSDLRRRGIAAFGLLAAAA